MSLCKKYIKISEARSFHAHTVSALSSLMEMRMKSEALAYLEHRLALAKNYDEAAVIRKMITQWTQIEQDEANRKAKEALGIVDEAIGPYNNGDE